MLEGAKEFLLNKVDEPAMNSSILPQKYKNKVQKSIVKINNFKKIGDLYKYLERFSKKPEPETDEVYDKFKSLNLLTYEDVFQEFKDKFKDQINDRTTLNDFNIGERYTSWDICFFANVYDTRNSIFPIFVQNDLKAIFIKLSLDGDKYENKWIEKDKEFKWYMYCHNGKYSLDYKVNQYVINAGDVPIYVFIKENDAKYELVGKFKYTEYHKESDGALWARLIKTNNQNNTWLGETINAIEALGGVAHLSKIYDYIKSNAKKELTTTWENTVRRELYAHSSDSKYFDSTNNEDLFTAPEGIGAGIWALRIKIKESPKAPDINIPEESNLKIPGRTKSEIYRIIRDSQNSKIMKLIYSNRCQICGHRIELKNNHYSEAHHIKPLGEGGSDHLSNMIVLCPNHHVEFDYAIMAINPETLEIIHKDTNNEYIGKKVFISKENHHIKKEYLAYHLQERYLK